MFPLNLAFPLVRGSKFFENSLVGPESSEVKDSIETGMKSK